MVIHVSKRLRYERCETTSASDREVEAQSCFKLTLEYRLSWGCPTIRKRRGWRVTGKSDGWERPTLRGRRTDRRVAAAALSNDRRDEGKDLLELIGGQPDGEPTAQRDMSRESPTEDLTLWLDSSNNSSDTVCSGPSSPQVSPFVGRGRGLCSRCQVVWEKAWHKKRRLKDKLLDNDPSSLSCDQWVLKKTWRRSGMHVRERNLLKLQGCLELIQIRQSNVYNVTQGQSACSRAHTFLQRNLRLCTKASARRGRKRKSTRKAAAKRARRDPHQETPSLTATHSHHHHHGGGGDDDLPSPGPHTGSSAAAFTLDRLSEEDNDNGGGVTRSPAQSAPERVPSSVTMDTRVEQEAVARQEVPAKRGGFKDLLTQMRGNSCLIVREHRQ